MVLIDEKKGVLTQSCEFRFNIGYDVIEVVEPAKMADVLKVHDYRYIKNYLTKEKMLKERLARDEGKDLANYDRDSYFSSATWEAALLSCGSIITACQQVMDGETRNAFCAVRPPGHHAGVFGSTFKKNECNMEEDP